MKEQCLADNSDCLGEAGAMSCQCKSDYIQMPGTDTCLKSKRNDFYSKHMVCSKFEAKILNGPTFSIN